MRNFISEQYFPLEHFQNNLFLYIARITFPQAIKSLGYFPLNNFPQLLELNIIYKTDQHHEEQTMPVDMRYLRNESISNSSSLQINARQMLYNLAESIT